MELGTQPAHQHWIVANVGICHKKCRQLVSAADSPHRIQYILKRWWMLLKLPPSISQCNRWLPWRLKSSEQTLWLIWESNWSLRMLFHQKRYSATWSKSQLHLYSLDEINIIQFHCFFLIRGYIMTINPPSIGLKRSSCYTKGLVWTLKILCPCDWKIK